MADKEDTKPADKRYEVTDKKDAPSDKAEAEAPKLTTGDPAVDAELQAQVDGGVFGNFEAAMLSRESSKPADSAGGTKDHDTIDDLPGNIPPGAGRP